MAITTAQVSATKKSRTTQAASNTPRIAIAARVSARVRESKSSAGFSKGRSWLPSFLGKIPWRGMSDYIPVAPAHSSPLSPASAEVNLHACADVDGHQLPISSLLPPRLTIIMVSLAGLRFVARTEYLGIAPCRLN